MTTAFRVRFVGLPNTFVATPWQIPNHAHEFEPMPANATRIFVPQTKAVFRNRPGDRRPQEVGLDETRKWGFDDADETELIFAQAKTADGTKRFCLRMILNAQRCTVDNHSNTFGVYTRLVNDAKFHSTHLVEAEGTIVPIHYGMWLMETGEWAGTVLFSITQWGGISWNELSHTKMNTEANRILIGRTFEALHDFGIDHGGLPSPHDLRHVVIDIHAPGLSRAQLLDGKAPCYIVDFSEAQAGHKCARKLPILPMDVFLRLEQVGCVETRDAIYMLKFMRRANTVTPASEALEWHATYSDLYPDAKNLDVLVAQRAKLYPDMPPVYPALLVSFESDDLHAPASITSVTNSDDEEREAEDSIDASRADSVSPETVSDPAEILAHKLRLTNFDGAVVSLKTTD